MHFKKWIVFAPFSYVANRLYLNFVVQNDSKSSLGSLDYNTHTEREFGRHASLISLQRKYVFAAIIVLNLMKRIFSSLYLFSSMMSNGRKWQTLTFERHFSDAY